MGTSELNIKRQATFSLDRQPIALTVGGFDPTSGAGVVADIKAMHSQGVYGLGVLSCNTIQTDNCFEAVDWVEKDFMLQSIKSLTERFAIQAVKIGALKSRQWLEAVLSFIRTALPDVPIVWDPVLAPTAGGSFFELSNQELAGDEALDWQNTVKGCTLITPNLPEAAVLCRLLGLHKDKDPQSGSAWTLDELAPRLEVMSRHAAILLKGGHLKASPCDDRLYEYDQRTGQVLTAIAKAASQPSAALSNKHGSGCVHSSTIAACLAKGDTLTTAMHQAKKYVERYLSSSPGLLGLHGLD